MQYGKHMKKNKNIYFFINRINLIFDVSKNASKISAIMNRFHNERQ